MLHISQVVGIHYRSIINHIFFGVATSEASAKVANGPQVSKVEFPFLRSTFFESSRIWARMSLGHVRPSPAGTPGPMRTGTVFSARNQPYPPAHSGGKPSGRLGGAGSIGTPRNILRDKWTKLFGGGASN